MSLILHFWWKIIKEIVKIRFELALECFLLRRIVKFVFLTLSPSNSLFRRNFSFQKLKARLYNLVIPLSTLLSIKPDLYLVPSNTSPPSTLRIHFLTVARENVVLRIACRVSFGHSTCSINRIVRTFIGQNWRRGQFIDHLVVKEITREIRWSFDENG